jgi:predicted nucleotidyltransferase
MYTIRPDKPLNPVIVDILTTVQVVTEALGYGYLLVGATVKLLAWNDRGLQDNKDAQDLFFLLQHYHEAGNDNRMYEEALALLEACGFDLPLAGAALLGHDAGKLLEAQSLRALLAILADPRKRDRLVVHMTRSAGIESALATRLLNQFERGLQMKKIPAA